MIRTIANVERTWTRHPIVYGIRPIMRYSSPDSCPDDRPPARPGPGSRRRRPARHSAVAPARAGRRAFRPDGRTSTAWPATSRSATGSALHPRDGGGRCRRRSSAFATASPRRCRSARWTGSGRAPRSGAGAATGGSRRRAPAGGRDAGSGPMPGSAGCSTRWAGRWTGAGRCRRGRVRVRSAPPPPEATTRARLGPRLDLGVRALDCFTTCRQGQRLGLFSGSGIGKSTLLAMLARDTAVRRGRAGPGRRARPRGAGVPRGRSGRGGAGALGRRGRHLRRAAAAAPPGGLCRDDGGRAFPRPGAARCCC